jgi:hypothetical protein
VEEDDKYNVLTYMNIYTGAGVAAGDVNNDGLVDLFLVVTSRVAGYTSIKAICNLKTLRKKLE